MIISCSMVVELVAQRRAAAARRCESRESRSGCRSGGTPNRRLMHAVMNELPARRKNSSKPPCSSLDPPISRERRHVIGAASTIGCDQTRMSSGSCEPSASMNTGDRRSDQRMARAHRVALAAAADRDTTRAGRGGRGRRCRPSSGRRRPAPRAAKRRQPADDARRSSRCLVSRAAIDDRDVTGGRACIRVGALRQSPAARDRRGGAAGPATDHVAEDASGRPRTRSSTAGSRRSRFRACAGRGGRRRSRSARARIPVSRRRPTGRS